MKVSSGNRIREHRTNLGMSSLQVAELLNTSPQTICRIETGGQSLTLDWMERFAGVFSCEMADLLPFCENYSKKQAEIADMREKLSLLDTENFQKTRRIAELERVLACIRDQADIWKSHD